MFFVQYTQSVVETVRLNKSKLYRALIHKPNIFQGAYPLFTVCFFLSLRKILFLRNYQPPGRFLPRSEPHPRRLITVRFAAKPVVLRSRCATVAVPGTGSGGRLELRALWGAFRAARGSSSLRSDCAYSAGAVEGSSCGSLALSRPPPGEAWEAAGMHKGA